MAMKPRARRGRPSNTQRSWSGPRPSPASDPRRRPRRQNEPNRRAEPNPNPDPDFESTTSRFDRLLDDFTESWERGECPRAELYLDLLRHEEPAELIYHEYCLAEGSNLAPDPSEYLRRFPEQADSLGRLFALHGAISPAMLRDLVDPDDLPEAGDEIGPYRLLRELGRGAFARVFLVEQADLDNRLVVLKVSTRSTAEPRLLARARHPHIVEVLRHDVANDGALHLVCLPFLGGATLASILEGRRKLDRRPRSGRDLLADLDRASAPEYPSADPTRPARALIAGVSYPKALAWIVARLAEALDHAHQRGVVHGDLKPSNVLVTAEGVPMLFDFNLSVDWRGIHPGDPSGDLGGTIAYMAPERLKSIAEGASGPAPEADGLHRADLYAIGLLLLESLTGQAPELPRHGPKDTKHLALALAGLRQSLPVLGRSRSIPPALRSILSRCLAPDPAARYARGQELAEDLDRWRLDRPLRHADESQSSALTRKFRRRRAPLFVLGLTLASALAVAFFASMILTGTKGDVAEAKYAMVRSQPDPGVFRFRRIGSWPVDDPGDPVTTSARLLARYDVLGNPDWQDQDDIRMLPDQLRGELEAWLFEQILRHAVALRERPNAPGDWQRALDLIDRTVARVASAPLEAERIAIRARLNLPDPRPLPARRPRLAPWMEEHLAGVAAEPLHARAALDHYLGALRGRPGLFWAHYRAAAAANRIGEYGIAVEQLRECLRRNPENPALHLHLASSLFHLERNTFETSRSTSLADALAECDRAIALDPDYAPSYHFRAYFRKASGRVEAVNEDVERYASLTKRIGPAPKLTLLLSQYFDPGSNYECPEEVVEALSRKILDDNPRDPGVRVTLAARIAMDDRPAEAIKELDRVLLADPEDLLARYQRAVQVNKLDRDEAILEYSNLIADPRFEEIFAQQPTAIRAFHYVATDLMKRDKLDEALEVAHRGLVHANKSRSLQYEAILAHGKARQPIALNPLGETYYLIARIHAAAARTDPGRIGPLIENLGRAFACHGRFRKVWYATDPRFDNFRDPIALQLQLEEVDR